MSPLKYIAYLPVEGYADYKDNKKSGVGEIITSDGLRIKARFLNKMLLTTVNTGEGVSL